jgi:hypothetical protein
LRRRKRIVGAIAMMPFVCPAEGSLPHRRCYINRSASTSTMRLRRADSAPQSHCGCGCAAADVRETAELALRGRLATLRACWRCWLVVDRTAVVSHPSRKMRGKDGAPSLNGAPSGLGGASD